MVLGVRAVTRPGEHRIESGVWPMGKLLGFCFFVAGIAAVYLFGVRPLVAGTPPASSPPIALTPRSAPTPVFNTDQRQVAQAANAFLQDWQATNYSHMYDALTSQAQQRLARSSFVARYRAVMAEATVRRVQAAVRSVTLSAPEATAVFTATLETRAVGTIAQQNQMHLLYEHGQWLVDWYPALIFKQLEDPYVVHLQTVRANRGAIRDRNGTPLAEDGQFEQVGVVPGQITDENLLLTYLSGWLHMTRAEIKHLYTLSWAQPDYFMPITTLTQPQVANAPPGLRGVQDDGMVMEAVPGRIYPQGSVAAALIGYVDPTTGHGRAGLEQTLDQELSGRDGVQLLVMNQAHTMTAATIAALPAVNGRDVRLTIDLPTQAMAERSLGIRNGAAVAIDPGTGQVLALAGTPGYDPNRFEVPTATKGIGPIRSMFPRATLGTYPIGSIFKIVTMAAALERGGYSADTPIDGPGVWYGLGASHPLHDWLATGHGTISLQEALTQSCDTCFYQVAQKLDGINAGILPSFARGFGFGSPTGLDAAAEASGLVGDNAWKQKTLHDAWRTGDSVNLSIGQGYFLATPLQTAAMLAAVGDGGVRRPPRLILSVGGVKAAPAQPARVGTLPLSAAHLRSIVQGMIGVTTEDTGTATFVFRGFPWQVAGKTGTAQNPGGLPHAWFGAIAPAAHPRIALAVVVENGGEGSQVAAPIARAVLQTYLSEVAKPTSTGPQGLTVPSQ